ncbi:unnamed protein product [Echinostoma caproni]|uniref:Tick transposon n=1 Tax=Echinostoma caproni TaxID=27848 RepID=A0A183BGI2_9TREM|nr:unnamed protein product [Echinostoma caproni]
MITGREMRLPSDASLPAPNPEPLYATPFIRRLQSSIERGHRLARLHLQAAQRYQKAYFNHRANQATYRPGERVWLSEPAAPGGVPTKLHRQWKGPFVVQEVLSDRTVRLTLPSRPQWSTVVHINRLKPGNHITDSAEDSAILRGVCV